MATNTALDEDAPMRIWRRTEKRWQRLKRWGSLPSWQLSPRDRPLFQCRGCGDVNTYGELCLHCGLQECVTLTVPAVKRRRVSSPPLLTDRQKEQLHRLQNKQLLTLGGPARELVGCKGPVSPVETRTGRRRRHRAAAVYSIDDITAVAGLNAEAKFYVQSIVAGGSPDTSSPLTPPPVKVCPRDAIAVPILSNPPRTLKRKHRFSLDKQRPSPARENTMVSHSGEKAWSTPPSSPLRACFHAVPMTPSKGTPPCVEVPLGHPARPIYTAIRKNMFSPATPPSSDNASSIRATFAHGRDTSERAKSLDLHTSPVQSLDEGESYTSRYIFIPRAVDLSSGIGFSVTGETELRMALSRRYTTGGSSTHPEYKFEYQEAKRLSGMKIQAKRIGRGLKNLFMLRRAMPISPQL